MISKMVPIAVSVRFNPQRAKAAFETHIPVRIIGGQLGEKIQMPPWLEARPGQNARRLNSQGGGPLDQKREGKAQTVPRHKGGYASLLRECSQPLPESLEEVFFIVECSGNGHRELWHLSRSSRAPFRCR